MDKILELLPQLPQIWAVAQDVLGAAAALVTALIALFLVIPGEQPEKALKAVAEALAKISVKKK